MFIEAGEECEGTTTETCVGLGFTAGSTSCSPTTCQVDTSACAGPTLVDLVHPLSDEGLAVCGLYADGSLVCTRELFEDSSNNPLMGLTNTGPFEDIAGGRNELCAVLPTG